MFKKILDFCKKHSDLIGYILLAILFVAMNIDVYKNLDLLMESDFSSELVLAKLLAQEKKIFTTSWYYSTELRVLNSNLVSSILFLFLNDWHLIRILTIVLMEVVLFFGYYYLAKKLDLKHIPWIAFLVIGVTSRDYFKFVLLCSSYIPHVVIAYVSIGLLIAYFKSDNKNKKIMYLIILFLLAYFGGLEGTRLMSITYIPLVVAAVINCFIKELDLLKEGKFNFKDETFILFVICCFGFVFSFAGAFTNIFILPRFGFSYKLDTARIYYTDMNLDNLAAVLTGWMDVFGYQADNLEVLSKSQIILKPLFAALFVLIIWATIDIMSKDKYDKYEKFITLFFLCGVGILTLLFTFTTSWYKNRYLLPISVFSVIILGIFFKHYKVTWQKCLYILVIVLFTSYNTKFQIDWMKENETYKEFIGIKDMLLENDCHNGYCDFHWNGHNLLTELSDGDIETWCFHGNIDNVADWLQAKSHEYEKPQGKTFLLLLKDYVEYNMDEEAEKYKYYEDDEKIMYIFDNYEQIKLHMN